jgi:hypothetical protein
MKYWEAGENCIMSSFGNFYSFLAKYNQNDDVKEDEVGMTFSTHGGEEECI